ncbi:MAG: cohesin domain-containing protein [Patescibacteria group bacterium]
MNLPGILQKHKRPIIFALMIFLAFFLFGLSIYSNQVLGEYKKDKLSQAANQITHQFNQDLELINNKMDNCACSEEIIPFIQGENIPELLKFLEKQKQDLDIDAVLVTDEQGIALTRTEYKNIRGDYIFSTTPWGEAVSRGEKIVAIEKGSPLPLIFVAGKQIEKNGQMIGAIFVAKIINQEYISGLKENFLPGGEIILYSQEQGVLASSFETDKEKALAQSFFNAGTDWFNQNLEKTALIKIDNDNYLAKNLIFPGINHSPGGLIILHPEIQIWEIFALALASTLFFTGFLSVFALILKQGRLNKKIFITIACLSFIFGGICFGTVYLINSKTPIQVKKLTETVYNSTLKLEPDSGIFNKDYEHEIKILASSGGETVNAFEINLDFDPEIINLKEIKTENSICTDQLFLEKTIDNQKGKIRISCIIPNPGFNQNQGELASLVIKPIKQGTYELKITEESRVLANDGLGTDVLRASQSGSYRIVDSGEKIPEILVFSDTHPNNSLWYRSREIHLSWIEPNKNYRSFAWTFNREPDYVPDKNFWAEKKSVNAIVFNDGIYYFHIAGIKNNQLGPVSHYQVKIDSTPPEPIKINTSEKTIKLGELLRVEFETKDTASGIESYYVKINNNAFFPARSPLFVILDKLGNNTIAVRAFDRANNFRDSEIIIQTTEKNIFQKIIKNSSETILNLTANLGQIVFK